MFGKFFVFFVVAGYGGFLCFLFAVPREEQGQRKKAEEQQEERKAEAPTPRTPKVEPVGEKPPETPKTPAKQDPPRMSREEAQQLFQDSIKEFQGKRYDKAIAGFRRIFDQIPREDLGYASAYNIACALALKGDRAKALDWLEKAVASGYSDFEAMRRDADLISLRSDPRFRRLINR